MAAQADQWICESTHAATLTSGTDLDLTSEEYKDARLIVETDKGFKIPDSFGTGVSSDNTFASEYEGTCSVFNIKFITCHDIARVGDSARVTSLLLDVFWGTYSYSVGSVQHTAGVSSHVGKCTKL
jgi:hypothetical protein